MREIRVHNASTLLYTNHSVANEPYGDLAAGETSEYKSVSFRFGYAVVKLSAGGRTITGQTLNFGAKRFTYRVGMVDLTAGQLASEVVRN